MASLNEVNLIGRLGQDPTIRVSQSGSKIGSLSIATSESWTDKQTGERTEKTEWHRVVTFGNTSDIAERYFRKGNMALVKGRLQTRKYEKDGVEHYVTEIVADRILNLSPREEGSQSQRTEPARQTPAPKKITTEGAPWDDEVPF